MRIRTVNDLPTHMRAAVVEQGKIALVARKYGNTPTIVGGRKLDSKREAQAWRDFQAQVLCGAIRACIPQVSLPLPGTSRRIRIDFAVVELDGHIRFYDAKGYEPATSKLKRQQLLEGYGIEVRLL